jgi:hypothetical protein
MQVRLKKHEILIASLLTALAAFSYIRNAIVISSQGMAELFELYQQHGLVFSYLPNVLYPKLGVVLTLFGIHLWLNLMTIPHFRNTKNKSLVDYLLVFSQLAILSLVLCLSVNVATFYAHPSWFNYGGFGLFSILGYNDVPLKHVLQGFDRALTMMLIYMVYAALREYVVYKLENLTTKRNYSILICNQVSTFICIYFCVPLCLFTFQVINESSFYSVYFIFATSSIPIYFINTYMLFNQIDETPRLILPISLKLLIATLGFSFPIALWFFPDYGPFMSTWLSNWSFQLFVFTPITWFIYLQQKDQINEYRGVHKALAKSTADLQLLRSQINPHFLFNALNNLYGVALMDGSKRTAEGIQKLGDMMRFMLADNHHDFIPLKNEIAYITNYLSMQELRISADEQVKITADLAKDVDNLKIVPMLLVPLVENAFKHGINFESASWVNIVLTCDDQSIRFKVANSYHGEQLQDPERHHSGIGLQNVKERLEIFYKNNYQFSHGVVESEYISEIQIEFSYVRSF